MEILRKKVVYETNPFLGEVINTLTETVKTKREFVNGNKAVSSVISTESGEIIGETALMHYHKVDTETFIKIYSKKAKGHFEMPKAAATIFEYILGNLRKNAHSIHLYDKDLKECCKMSLKTYYRGIHWLVESKMIAKSTRPYLFFINPAVLFNGDRLTLVDVYERDKQEKVKELDGGFKQLPLPQNTDFINQAPSSEEVEESQPH